MLPFFIFSGKMSLIINQRGTTMSGTDTKGKDKTKDATRKPKRK